jgi:hypothetical protein
MTNFSVICSYKNHPQDIFDISTPGVTDGDVLSQILDTLPINKINELEKISLRQILNDDDEPFDWIVKTNGKFFFPSIGQQLYLERRLAK